MSVLNVVLAVVAIEAAPHTRGIGFFPVLRYAIAMPACVVISVAATFSYLLFRNRSSRPRWTLALSLLGLVSLLAVGISMLGPKGLVLAALPAMLTVAITTTVFVPYFVQQTRRFLFAKIAIVILGSLQSVALVGALSSERFSHANGSVFEIPRELADFDQRFIEVPSGASIHYADEGQGETLLFLHGNPSWSFQWRELIHGLRSSYRCVALDYPGFGMSTAPSAFGFTPAEESKVVEEFVDRLGLHDVTLVMQDWGGPIGIALAERRPDLVRRIILGSTWAWDTPTSEPRGKFSVIFGGPIGEFIQTNFPGVISLGLKHDTIRKLPPEVVAIYTRPFLPPERRGITSFYPGQITQARDFFKQLVQGLPALADKPTLIFWALKDPGFPRADLIRWQKAFPNQRTVEFENSSHFFFEDNVNEMITSIRTFMPPDRTQGDVNSK